MTRFVEKLRCLIKSRDGVAAVEFAISAPMLIIGVVIMTDLGLAVHERMNLDQAVRSGAEFVMNDVSDKDEIKKLVIAAATGTYSDNPSDAESADRPTVSVPEPTCECPDNPGVAVVVHRDFVFNRSSALGLLLYSRTKDVSGVVIA